MNGSRKKVAIICLSPYAGGMEMNSIKLARKLSNETDVVLIAKRNYFIENQKDSYVGFNDIKLETVDFKNSFSLSIIKNVRKIVKQYNIKNVIFFGASEMKSLFFAFYGMDINLIIRHGTTKTTPKKDCFHKLIYSNVNYHISICKHLQNNVEYIIPFGKNTKSKLIYSSINSLIKNKTKSEKLTILHTGRIARGKGQSDAIIACDILYKNGIDFVFNVVGTIDKNYEKEFMEFFDACEYKQSINLVGYSNSVKEYLKSSDIFLFPSYGEGLSNSFLEALASNLICISYNNTSFPELKELGFEFFMARNKDTEDLKNILLNVITNLDYNKNKAMINNDIIKEFFSEEIEIKKYIDILI